ncbi:hypothetical protein E2C01_079824 [Portunus trituberculatus]|uniref:Uncharacterized protein n=1 Tax=Portunus trituberculatus TaxID=210409 RepID=A0A5B7IRJ3_PORTR|nr:hypothetical protein [Portunus trituberculatus]
MTPDEDKSEGSRTTLRREATRVFTMEGRSPPASVVWCRERGGEGRGGAQCDWGSEGEGFSWIYVNMSTDPASMVGALLVTGRMVVVVVAVKGEPQPRQGHYHGALHAPRATDHSDLTVEDKCLGGSWYALSYSLTLCWGFHHCLTRASWNTPAVTPRIKKCSPQTLPPSLAPRPGNPFPPTREEAARISPHKLVLRFSNSRFSCHSKGQCRSSYPHAHSDAAHHAPLPEPTSGHTRHHQQEW